ncbi:oligosaccharide flippase family protein [Psychroflexus salis]|uniref:Polysaccharide biosynthesis protein n=1 Tax=Psychroflexus salis TaxID=1526574 RepID=A0A916ZKP9_9FLAO|nr:oligosaccharide flippase family protein [Psychroflexus salis]GGE02583.1 polysaccharide biosynthesis protein [Psychroflexus salis]
MGVYKQLFQNTFLYGVASVVPRMLSVILVPFYTGILANTSFGEYSIVFAYFVIFNVILTYGMETAFFRFYNKERDKAKVTQTANWSIIFTTVAFVCIGFLLFEQIQSFTQIKAKILQLVIWILAFDVLAIIPFAWLRANNKPLQFTVIKIINVSINLGLNVFLIYLLPKLVGRYLFLEAIYIPNYEVEYIFWSLFVASTTTLLLLSGFFRKLKWSFDKQLWKSMMKYALPILVAGVAFSINEVMDRLLLERILPANIAKEQIGIYSACYKLGMFITLFATAFRLGIEPFFFSHASSKNPKKAYALITKYFLIVGAAILLVVLVFIDPLKKLIIRDESYWEAMQIVPIILVANLFLGMYHNFSVWYKVTDKTKYGAYISSFGAISTIVLNLWLIPKIGYVGSAIATLFAYASMAVLSYFIGKKHYAVPYAMGKIITYLSVSILFSVLSFYVFSGNYYIGIGFILVFSSLVYVFEKQEIIHIFKMDKNEN